MDSVAVRFNPKRMLDLSRIALVDEWRPYMFAGLIIGGVLLFTSVLFRGPSPTFFLNIMLLIGMVLVSKAFAEAHEKEKGIHYFMLPAAIEEKYLVKLLSTLVLFFLFALLVCLIANRLSIVIAPILFSSASISEFDPFRPAIFDKFKLYLFFHSLFFAGSIFFRKNSFFKTCLILMAAIFISVLAMGSFLKNYLAQFQSGNGGFYFRIDNMGDLNRFLGREVDFYLLAFQVTLFVIIPLLLYIVSFMKFKKMDVKG